MKRKFLLATVALSLIALNASAQTSKGYAITGNQTTKDYNWLTIAKIDINSGNSDRLILDQQNTPYKLVDAKTKKTIANRGNDQTNYIAATAYDRKSGKLYYIPMYSSELRWIDMDDKATEKTIYTLQSDLIQRSNMQVRDESKNITRMVIGADGAGYAISNDGNNFYRFTTGKNPSLVDMGALIDHESNKTVSVHNKCSSWGGDMVADADGNFILISAQKKVFEIDGKTRVATLIGSISGLPDNFTANGAAVDEENNIIISSAYMGNGFYKVSLKDLSAVKMQGSDMGYSVSDLATPNLLASKNSSTVNDEIVKATVNDNRIFPNPVTANTFRLEVGDIKAGAYSVNISDLAGKTIQNDRLNLRGDAKFANINLKSKPVAGVYMVKVVNSDKNIVITEKLVIQ